MLVKVLKAKIHQATVTQAKLYYSGSIAIDPEIMKLAGIGPYESVIVADLENGNRLETYAIAADDKPGSFIILGAAAKLIKPKHKIIIMNFAYLTPEEAQQFKPKVIILSDENKIVKVK